MGTHSMSQLANRLRCSVIRLLLRSTTRKFHSFSWKLQDGRIGAKQTAYRILVARDPDILKKGNADVWDSGRVESDRSIGVAYGGPNLAPETRYYWRVQVWDKDRKA